MTLKVIHRLQTFSHAIRRTFVQHFTRFQLTVYSHGSSAVAELLVSYRCYLSVVVSFSVHVKYSYDIVLYNANKYDDDDDI